MTLTMDALSEVRKPIDVVKVTENDTSHVLAAWAPYFDNMDAIIFLAPISAFDEVLVEDTSVNRLVRIAHRMKVKIF